MKTRTEPELTLNAPVAERQTAGGEEFVQKLLNLKDGLERLLNGSEESTPVDPERSVRQERSLEILLWLLNLESRLPPYGDEQPA